MIRNGADTLDVISFESCRSSVVGDTGEVSSESSRRMQDNEETSSEASWTTVTKGKEKDVWRLELEGESEKSEVTVLWNEAEGVSENLEGRSHHEQTRSKITRRDREDQAKMERKADRNAPGEEG